MEKDKAYNPMNRRTFIRRLAERSIAGASLSLSSSAVFGASGCGRGPLAPAFGRAAPALGTMPDAAAALQAAINLAKQQGRRLVTFKRGTYRLSTSVLLDGIGDLQVIGSGITLVRGAPDTSFFRIVGCRDLKISGFTLEGGFSASDRSTGGSPAIMVGTVDRSEERGNSDVEVSGNMISGSDWAGITVFGNHGGRNIIKNRRIVVCDNVIQHSSAGIIVYKNASNIEVARNTIRDCAQDGIGVDTRAGTDPAGSEANFNITISDNVIERVGRSQQGIGINLKGDNREAVVVRNSIRDSGSEQDRPFNSYGIVVNHDTSNSSASGVELLQNDISIVMPKGETGTGIYIGSFARDVKIAGNSIRDTKSGGIVVMRSSDVSIERNLIDSVSLVHGAGIQVDGDPAMRSDSVHVSENDVSRGRGVGIFGLYFGYSTRCSADMNRVTGFPTPLFGLPNEP